MKKVILPILEKKSNKKNGKGFELISNPEFLQESSAIRDTEFPHAIVLGGNQTEFMKKAKKLFVKLHPNTPIIITNHQTAEIIKYANNSFLATKISFINNISNLCQTLPGTNIDEVAKAIGIDPRIGNQFLNAGPGYGGSCLPKDVQALIACQKDLGVESTLLNAVHQTNVLQIKKIIELIKKTLVNVKNKRITILGLSFKEESDDIRESRSIKLIEMLLEEQSTIIVHDPKAIKNTKEIFKEKINYAKTVEEALEKSQCVIIMTQWKQYETLTNNQFKYMRKKFVIDCRRMLAKKQLNVDYFAIGLGKKD